MTQPRHDTSGAPQGGTIHDPAFSPATTAVPEGSRFVWHDLMSTDPARTLAFYQALLGWTTTEMPMGEGASYTMLFAEGQGIGGVVPLDPSHGVPSHWIGYLSVPDVDRAVARAAELGGRPCVPPTDIPNVGRFAVVEDPSGAVFSPFTPLPGQEDPNVGAPPPIGGFCWDELSTSDPATALRFYGELTGWRWEEADMGEAGSYWMAGPGDTQVAGLMQLPAQAAASGVRPHWLPYVRVADTDASTARVAELGGSVLVEPTDIPGIGRFAVATDPAGAPFALFRDPGCE